MSSIAPSERTIVNACGLLQDGAGRYLLVHRRPDRARWPGLWYLPGGEALDDEDVDDTLVRELREELGVTVRSFQFVETIFDQEPVSGRRAVHNIYVVGAYEGAPALLAPDEHDALEWVDAEGLTERVPPSLRAALAPILGPAAGGASQPIRHVDHEQAWDTMAERYQAQAAIPTDVIHYGATTPTENELRLLGDPSGMRLIEVGCGGGQNAIAFKRAGAARVLGVDQSAAQLRFAAELAATEGVAVEFHKTRVETLDGVPDASFDLAFSAYCFQFVQDVGAACRAVHRVLRPGGRFAFCLDHPAHMLFGDDGVTLAKPYFQRDAEWLWPFDDGSFTRMTATYHTIQDLFDALVGAGFVVDRLLEPEFRARRVGGWRSDPELARRVPRTVIFAAHKPESSS